MAAESSWRALRRAIEEDDIHGLKSTLTEADVDIQNEDGNTALHIALMWNKKDCALLLLEKGASTDIKNNSDDTAEMILAKSHDADLKQAALEGLKMKMKARKIKIQKGL